MKNEFVIIGSGIGGLTFASILEQLGMDYIMLEKRSSFAKFGSGLSVMSNAINALKAYNLDQGIVAKGEVISTYSAIDDKEKLIFSNDFKRKETICGAPSISISRQNLVNGLLENVDRSKIHFDNDVKTIEQHKDGYTISCANGKAYEAKYVVGADGINSRTREHLMGPAKIHAGGYECLLGLVDLKLDGWEKGAIHNYWGKGIRIGIVDIGFGSFYWWLTCNNELYKGKDWLMDYCAKWNSNIGSIIEEVDRDSVLEVSAKYLENVKTWTNGSMVIFGDASHAMLTSLGQGACQAIEDAVYLGLKIEQHPQDTSRAFHEFAAHRKKRVRKVADVSKSIASVEQWQTGFFTTLRNSMFRVLPNKSLEKVNLDILKYKMDLKSQVQAKPMTEAHT